jgi:hypothetical protein
MKPGFDTFVKHLGPPSNEEALTKYLDFCDYSATLAEDAYCENHHVLPCSVIKNSYTVRLKYSDHIEAHVLLSKAYKIRKFLLPLMWMKQHMSDEDMLEAKTLYGDIISKGWTYESRQAQSKRMKSLSKEEFSRRANLAWNNRTEEERKQFVEKMTKVNRDRVKIDKASASLKETFSKPEIKAKLANRPKRGKSTKDKEVWLKPGHREKMLMIRKISFLSRKFNMVVTEENVIECESLYNASKRKMNSSELNARPEVAILRNYYQLEKKMTGKPVKMGYYRKSTEFLLSEINRIRDKFGEIG